MDPSKELTDRVIVWRRKLDGDLLLQLADGKTWRLPRHTEIANGLARKICRALGIPEVGT